MKNDDIKKLLNASNEIHKKSIRGKGDWIITGPQVAENIKKTFEEIEIKQKTKDRKEHIDNLLNNNKDDN